MSQPGTVLDNRQCSIQLTFHTRGVQPKILVIYRGTGKRISQAEQDINIDGGSIFFQKKAWSDRQVWLHWDETFLKDNLDEHHVCSDGTREYTLQLYDNLDGHIFLSFIKLNHVCCSFCHFLPKNMTYNLALTDDGLVSLINYWIGIFLGQWIWEDNNIDYW